MDERLTELIAQKYSEIFVSRFHEIEGDSKTPWMKGSSHAQQNIAGTTYKGINSLLLSIYSSKYNYELPIWMTLKQANDFGIRINKGSKSVPVVFFDVYIWDTKNNRRSDVTHSEFKKMSKEERLNLKQCVVTKVYSVFNIAQTSFAETYPDIQVELSKHFGVAGEQVNCVIVDQMVNEKKWDCPIRIIDGEVARYRRDEDDIILPGKPSFASYQEYYSSLLHQMAHSTGCEERLDREYNATELASVAREELTVELSSAIMANLFGIEATISEENLKFLKGWVNTVEQNPEYIYSVVKDAASASNYICEALGIEQKKGLDITTRLEKIEKRENSRKQNHHEKAVRLSHKEDSVRVTARNTKKK